jgi:hypothetical protein
MRDVSYTEDFADICSCSRERHILIDIMRAWGDHGLPDDFDDTGVRPAFNRYSGYVFLVNEERQVCMLRDGKLESFYSSPVQGKEGFFSELADEYFGMHPDDQEWLHNIADSIGQTIPNTQKEES